MPPELTRKQQAFFEYLKEKINQAGKAPSLRQAASDLGISHAAVNNILKRLKARVA